MRRPSRRLFRHCSRAVWLGALCCLPAFGHAQNDRGSLTEDFPDLSAKERARIASKEKDDAAKDGAYQALMLEGERDFQEGRYEEALATYEKARAMRPYNVYPKVKIEDLRAILKKQAARPDSAVAATPPPVPAFERPVPVPPAAIEVSDTAKLAVRKEEPKPIVVPPVEEPPAKENAAAPVVKSLPAPSRKRDTGVIERRYREGHAYVIERAVEVDGRVVIYKRVFHNYGQVFYFEDGLSVDERVWKQRFPAE